MTNPIYHELLTRIRAAFPAPVSDRVHDAYFVFSIMRALDQVDAMKSEVPLLGRTRALDYASAEQTEMAEEGCSVEEVASLLVGKLEGLPIWGHSADASQRRPATVDPEHHRIAAASHLQSEPHNGLIGGPCQSKLA